MRHIYILASILLTTAFTAKAVPVSPAALPSFWTPVSEYFTESPLVNAMNAVADASNPDSLALGFLSIQLGLPVESFAIRNAYTSEHNGVRHVYVVQKLEGQEILNAVANVNIKDGQVVAWGHNLVTDIGREPVPTPGPVSAKDAVVSFARSLNLPVVPGSLKEYPDDSSRDGGSEGPAKTLVAGADFARSEIEASKKLIRLKDDVLETVWDMEVEMDDHWYNAFVSTKTGALVSLNDWSNDATYRVIDAPLNDPEEGEMTLVVDPEDKVASPLGWHSEEATKSYTTTQGNNAHAQNPQGFRKDYRPTATDLKFDFNLDRTKEPKQYVDAAVTNLFYWCNRIHDIFYHYGFNEVSGNFQTNNFGKGGAGNDMVVCNAQDPSGVNNANFMTPPDGKSGRMRMYVFTTTKPGRDGDLENDIVQHEYGHGISNRLTGGPANANCLIRGESGGMGEGWSDFFGIIFRIRPTDTRTRDISLGSYVLGKPGGIRRYPYSTNLKVNPHLYSNLTRNMEVHFVGEVWNAALYDMLWNLIDKFGFENDWFQATSKAGNIRALQVVLDGMKFQPCNPTFLQARDAILKADEVNYNGEAKCEIWKAFAKRGMGANAKTPKVDDFTLPAECMATLTPSS